MFHKVIDSAGYPELAALVQISHDGRTASFDPKAGFVEFPGGATKFTIRHDPRTDLYWSLANTVPKAYPGKIKPAGMRNTLALTSSPAGQLGGHPGVASAGRCCRRRASILAKFGILRPPTPTPIIRFMRLTSHVSAVAGLIALLVVLSPARAGDELLRPPPQSRPATATETDADSPLGPWRTAVKISLVGPDDCHSIHSYYISSPESPDGKSVLYYASTVPTGYEGEIRVVERATGRVRVLAKNITVEDAHRAACQQWISGGRQVAYHNVLKDNTWVVACVDVDTGSEHILARNRQIGFGQPTADLVPVYSPHWSPGDFRGLELVNAQTGAVGKTPVSPDAVKSAYPDWVAKAFGERPMSIFFPVLSPDTNRVFFKIATPAGGDFRSKEASDREGLFCYDLKSSRFQFMEEKWGHPAWNADSRQILNVGGVVTDSDTGGRRRIAHWPALPGSHPSFSPDGKLYASDSLGTPFGLPAGWWVVGVGDTATGEFVVVAKFDNSKGARSWRVSHPHPVFSPDGKRLYFNVSDGPYTRLNVAEASR